MRILAIRGANLASLAEFAIEFEKDPLAGAGLFAICGPTGAGKSTLLDALCVALFDKTPRLGERGGVPVGHPQQREEERLAANDVRGLLRRGAGEGHAEVDFRGRDQRRYRARWEVRRARNRPDGRLQKQEMSLHDLDSGKSLTGTKSETLDAIQDRLGLSFEQFRRSALLAQGEFAAFLRADASVRSELLERMTGTEIYSALSLAAFERQREEVARLKELSGELDRHAVLADEARAALEAHEAEARAALASIDAEIAAARKALEWHERLEQYATGESEARAALAVCEQAWHEAAPRRAHVAAVRAARSDRAALEAADRGRREEDRARAELVAAEAVLAEREAARAEAEELLAAAEAASSEARRALDQAEPALLEAEALDAEIAAARKALAEIAAQWQEAAGAVREVEDERARLADAVAAGEARQAELADWLRANEHAAPLAREWPRWRSALERMAGLGEDRRRLDDARPELLDEAERAEAARAQAHAEHERARDELDQAKALADKAQHDADAMPLEAARRARDGMSERAAALRRMVEAAERARDAVRARDRYAGEAELARQRVVEAKERAMALRADIDARTPELHMADRVLDRMRQAVALTAHRAELERGEPCPLCGATEHPWAEQGIVDEMLAGQGQLVASLRATIDALATALAEARALAESSEQRAVECDGEAQAAGERLASARTAWRREVVRQGELALMDDPASEPARAAAASRLEAAEAELERLRAHEDEAAKLQKDAQRAYSAVVTWQSNLAQARRELDEHDTAARAARDALHAHDAAASRVRDELARITRELAADLGEGVLASALGAAWQDALGRAAAAVQQRLQARVDAWTEHEAALGRVREELDAARGQLAGAQRMRDERARHAEALRARHDAQATEVHTLQARRAGVLGGRAAADVRGELSRRIAERERAERKAQAVQHERASAVAVANASREGWERSLVQAREHRTHADADLAVVLARAGLIEDALRRLCSVSDAELAEDERTLADLDRQRERAAAILTERETLRGQHEAGGRPALEPDAARAAMASGEDRRADAQRHVLDIERDLRDDDQARAARAGMAEELARQERRAHLYQNLSDLIGSADGKKFRVFAQSLTLDALLAYANHHLHDLASRYQLMRVPGHDLDLQVIDRDMGDEVRSINSLSGGESFLVSLALALGLSSLAARDTQVESLLIDEGFGSLDPATLDTALSVLDALQASGRKVGLISHVPGLAERVGVRIQVRPQGGGRSLIRVVER